MNFFDFFTDPVLRAPTIGSLLMCLCSALVGVLVFVRKRSLVGEALSHACYPGVTFAILIAGIFSFDAYLPFWILFSAFLSALAGAFAINFLEKKMKTASDSALCFILALFFGIGTTFASFAQHAHPHLFRQIQTYLYGQVATMTDTHIYCYCLLTLIVVLILTAFYKEILAVSFDGMYSKSLGLPLKFLEFLFFSLMALAIVIGIRSVGVILMSAMLIAPATAARQFTNRFSKMFLLSGIFGMLSGLFGVILSVTLSERLSFPTGPMIVLVSLFFAFSSLLFAPERGVVTRYVRVRRFKKLRIEENLLKTLWRLGAQKTAILIKDMTHYQSFSPFYLRYLLLKLRLKNCLVRKKEGYLLTDFGARRGKKIIRLHRLWELYLVNSLGLRVEKVHKSAEEMEHILTPELEKKLTELLEDPKQDPHDQPIPALEEVISHA